MLICSKSLDNMSIHHVKTKTGAKSQLNGAHDSTPLLEQPSEESAQLSWELPQYVSKDGKEPPPWMCQEYPSSGRPNWPLYLGFPLLLPREWVAILYSPAPTYPVAAPVRHLSHEKNSVRSPCITKNI